MKKSVIFIALVLVAASIGAPAQAQNAFTPSWVAGFDVRGALPMGDFKDIVSFGVAPAALGFGLGLRGGLDIIILIFFVACGISRLARYNVTASQLSDDSGKVKYFEGTPIPSSLFLVALLALCFYFGRTGAHFLFGTIAIAGLELHPFALLFFVNGCTMISKTLKIPKL